MPFNVGKAVGYLDLDTSGFTRGFNQARSDLRVFSDDTATVNDKLAATGNAMTSVGRTLTKTVTVPLVGLGATAVTVTSKFQSGMANVAAISGATSKDLERLSDKAKEMGAKTKFSASEAANAFSYMAMAGWKTEDMLNGIEGIMNLAAASGEDLALTSDIVTDALTAFGLQAQDSAHFADVLAAASNSSNTNVAMLGESFKYVAPIAGSLGYSIEDTSVALGLMANAGIKASQAGTTLRGALTRMVKPTDDAEAQMKKYGVSMFNADGSAKSLQEVMQNLRSSFGDISVEATDAEGNLLSYDEIMQNAAKSTTSLSDQEKLLAISTIFGQESMSGMLAIINASEDDFNNLSAAISSADGTAQGMADTMLNNLGGQLVILKSTLESIFISIGEVLMPMIRRFVSRLQELADKIANMSDEQKAFVVRLAAIATAIGPVLLVLGKLVTAASRASKVFSGLKIALAGLSGPAVAITAVIGTLVAAFMTLWNTNQEFRDNMTKIWEGIKDTFEQFAEGFVERINSLGFNFESVTEVLGAAWTKFCSLLAPIFTSVFSQIGTILQTALNTILSIFDIFKAVFSGDWSGAWESIKGLFGDIWDSVIELLRTKLGAIGGVFQEISPELYEKAKAIFDSIKAGFEEKWAAITEWFSLAKEDPVSALGELKESIKTAASNAFEGIKEGFSAKWAKILRWFSEAKSDLQNSLQSASSILYSAATFAFNSLKTGFQEVWSSIVEWFEEVKSNPVEIIFSTGTDLLQVGKNIMNNLWSGLRSVWESIRSWLNGIADWIKRILRINADVTVSMSNSYRSGNHSGRYGSFASGLDYVPRDMDVRVHEGESIRTREQTQSDRQSGGDTFNFYSPETIDAFEAARQFKKTKRELEEGF